MNLKNYFMLSVFTISSIVVPGYTMETVTQQFDPVLIKAVTEQVLKNLKERQMSNDTIAGNFSQAGPELINAAKDAGLGISRFVLNSSLAIKDLTEYFAKHYILFGAFIVSSAYFWWYIWPNITVRVHYNSDHRPPAPGR